MEDPKRRRVLIFAPAFAPFANAEALVNSKLVLAMLDARWEVEVISRRLADHSAYDYGSGWRDPWLPLRPFTHEIDSAYRGRIARIGEVILGALTTGAFIEGCRWAGKALRLAQDLHRKKRFDVVLSRAFPESAHAPAMRLARRAGIPWLANWNDPWDFLRGGIRGGSLATHLGLRRACFCSEVGQRATWHTFPAERLRQAMVPFLGRHATVRSAVIPHVALEAKVAEQRPANDTFTICYTGRLSRSQNPEFLFAALGKFLRANPEERSMRLRFIGIDEVGLGGLAEKHGLRSNLSVEPGVPYTEALAIAASSDVLLMIDPPLLDGMILSSKFVDYVQTGRPVLAITTKGGTLAQIIGTHGGGIAVDNSSEDELLSAIERLHRRWLKREPGDQYESDRLYRHFSPGAVLGLYNELLDRAGKDKAGR